MWNTPFYLLYILLLTAVDMYIQINDFAHAHVNKVMVSCLALDIPIDEEIDVLLRFVWYQDSWAVILASLVPGRSRGLEQKRETPEISLRSKREKKWYMYIEKPLLSPELLLSPEKSALSAKRTRHGKGSLSPSSLSFSTHENNASALESRIHVS